MGRFGGFREESGEQEAVGKGFCTGDLWPGHHSSCPRPDAPRPSGGLSPSRLRNAFPAAPLMVLRALRSLFGCPALARLLHSLSAAGISYL